MLPRWLLLMLMPQMAHDVGHVGRTNDFLIASESDLAVHYNDKVGAD